MQSVRQLYAKLQRCWHVMPVILTGTHPASFPVLELRGQVSISRLAWGPPQLGCREQYERKRLQNNLEYESRREGQSCYLEQEHYAKLGFEGVL